MDRFEPFLKAMKLLTEAQQLLERGPASYYTEEFAGAYEYLMTNFAPFKVGDKVMLIKVPKPFPTGWEHCAHFIVMGARAVVRSVHCDREGFAIDVHFNAESWIDRDGKVTLMELDRKHNFCFRATSFVKDED